ILVLITYIILGIILFRYYQYQINNDGIGYISTAKSYMSGNFYGSISDYWGPLFSWLMMPFLFFGQTPVTALHSTKILSLILGFFTIVGLRQLSYRFDMDEVVRTVVLFTMVPVVLYFALSLITPDLLMVCVLVYYLAIIFNPKYPNKLSNGVLCGIFGALAYLTKSYGFTFFIASFLILNFLQYFTDSDKIRRRKVLKNLILGFTVFLAISGVWIGLISSKDAKLTFGTAGEFNHELVGPQSQGFAEYSQGISKPGQVNPNFVPKPWSPFSSWSNFKYQLNLIWNNTLKIGVILNYFSYLSLLIILAYIIMCIQPPRKLISQNQVLYPLVTVLICAAGYVMILVEERYIWLIYVLLILMGGYLINLLFKTDFFTKAKFGSMIKVVKTVLLLVFAVSFITMPVNYLVGNVHTGEDIYNLSNTLMNQYGVHGNVAREFLNPVRLIQILSPNHGVHFHRGATSNIN
ncbi:MAG: hypothetical protein K8E24_009425, partial [Methanobacterium paludis]|nr:hypothetical protein [Methanobacterium paludis]